MTNIIRRYFYSLAIGLLLLVMALFLALPIVLWMKYDNWAYLLLYIFVHFPIVFDSKDCFK